MQGCWKCAASLGLFLLSGGAVAAQSNDSAASLTGAGSVEGTVFDSLFVKRPLRGATVYVIGATLTATTDSRGRFTIDGVPEGDHSLTFAHPIFDSAGVQAPQVSVHVSAGATARVAIATPRGSTLLRAACPGPRAEQTGLLMGVVRDVDSGAPLSDARVASRWFELTLDRQGRRYDVLETLRRPTRPACSGCVVYPLTSRSSSEPKPVPSSPVASRSTSTDRTSHFVTSPSAWVTRPRAPCRIRSSKRPRTRRPSSRLVAPRWFEASFAMTMVGR